MPAILGGPAPADPAPLLPLLLAGAAAAIAAAFMGAAATVATTAQVPAQANQVGGSAAVGWSWLCWISTSSHSQHFLCCASWLGSSFTALK
jgi:hypothetical protein